MLPFFVVSLFLCLPLASATLFVPPDSSQVLASSSPGTTAADVDNIFDVNETHPFASEEYINSEDSEEFSEDSNTNYSTPLWISSTSFVVAANSEKNAAEIATITLDFRVFVSVVSGTIFCVLCMCCAFIFYVLKLKKQIQSERDMDDIIDIAKITTRSEYKATPLSHLKNIRSPVSDLACSNINVEYTPGGGTAEPPLQLKLTNGNSVNSVMSVNSAQNVITPRSLQVRPGHVRMSTETASLQLRPSYGHDVILMQPPLSERSHSKMFDFKSRSEQVPVPSVPVEPPAVPPVPSVPPVPPVQHVASMTNVSSVSNVPPVPPVPTHHSKVQQMQQMHAQQLQQLQQLQQMQQMHAHQTQQTKQAQQNQKMRQNERHDTNQMMSVTSVNVSVNRGGLETLGTSQYEIDFNGIHNDTSSSSEKSDDQNDIYAAGAEPDDDDVLDETEGRGDEGIVTIITGAPRRSRHSRHSGRSGHSGQSTHSGVSGHTPQGHTRGPGQMSGSAQLEYVNHSYGRSRGEV